MSSYRELVSSFRQRLLRSFGRSDRSSAAPPVGLAIPSVTLLAVIAFACGGSTPVASHATPTRPPAPAASETSLEASPPSVASIAPSASSNVDVAAPALSASTAPSPPKLAIAAGTRVLVIGDSFVDAGFQQRLKKHVEEAGGKLLADAWTSSNTKGWATKDRLDKLLASFKPDVVIVTLGANEVFLPAPEAMTKYVRAINQKIGERACLWVSTPLWKGETGIVGVEKQNAGSCLWFDSSAVTIDRQPDKIHPTKAGGAAWADAVWNGMFSAASP